jgi:putative membrane protein
LLPDHLRTTPNTIRRRAPATQPEAELMSMKHGTITRTMGMMALAATLALGACASDDEAGDEAAIGANDTAVVATTDSAGMMHDTAAGAVEGGASWNDAQILGMLSAANTGEIAGGEAAQRMATDARVKAFARRMVTEHTAMQKQGTDLAQQLGVTPALPPDSALITDVSEDIDELSNKERGADWDEEYVEKQVDAHQKTLDLIDRAMRSTQSTQLRQLLEQARPKVEQHLNDARQLQNRSAS